MKTGILFACLVIVRSVNGQDAKSTVSNYPAGTTIPLVVMTDVPLRDAVANLAERGSLGNFIFDPRVTASFANSQNEFAREPMVTGRWEDQKAEQVLAAIMRKARLKVVTNTAGTVKRIVFESEKSLPVSTGLPTAASDEVIPLIVMSEVRLEDGILKLAEQAKLDVAFEEDLKPPHAWRAGKGILDSSVSLRWHNLTARQALDALLENYGLVWVPAVGGAPPVIKKSSTKK
jgi:hypothetical protein